MIDPLLIYLAILIFGINVIPAFMPPTWVVLAFFYATFRLPLFPTVVTGAVAATSGRIVLAYIARYHFRPLLPKETRENYNIIGKFFHTHHHITLPLLLLYAFFPLPSNQVYIIAGLANADIKIIAISFLFGRLISYTFWVTTAHHFSRRLSDLFGSYLTGGAIIGELVGFAVIFALGFVNWRKVFRRFFSEKIF